MTHESEGCDVCGLLEVLDASDEAARLLQRLLGAGWSCEELEELIAHEQLNLVSVVEGCEKENAA